MKKLSVILSVALMILFIFSVVGPGAAEERATREECVAKTKQAAKLIEEVGLKTALEKMNDMKGPFVWKDAYVYCFEDETGKILAHKNQILIGFEAKDLRDVNGKPYFREMFHVANTKGEGFVTYMYPRIPGGSPESKISYILKVPGTNVILGAGFFE
jgi:signal transduction histidine kinase